MPNYTLSLYLGSNEDGEKLLQRVKAYCLKENISVSEYVVDLIMQDLKRTPLPSEGKKG